MVDLQITTVNLSAPDVALLAGFYARLLGYDIAVDEGDWVLLRDPRGTGPALAVQHEANYARPVWPSRPSEPDMKIHLEIRVDDLAAGVEHAVASGAVVADHQPQPDVRVCLDSAGHPFCLWVES